MSFDVAQFAWTGDIVIIIGDIGLLYNPTSHNHKEQQKAQAPLDSMTKTTNNKPEHQCPLQWEKLK